MGSTPDEAPRHETASERSRGANDRSAVKARRLAFVSPVPFVCECSDLSCRELMPLRLEAYAGARESPKEFLTVPEHRLLPGRVVRKLDAVWVHVSSP